MSPARFRRAADVAPSARRRTRPPSRTGSVESGWSRKEQDAQYTSAWEARTCTCESMAARESGNNEPFVELMEDVIHALDRLDRCDYGKKRVNGSAISV